MIAAVALGAGPPSTSLYSASIRVTVYHLARHGSLPASRLGRTWRFLRPRIEELLRA